MPERNRTTDETINDLSVRDLRVVITKDTDFVDSFLLSNEPHKLLLITTGNVGNAALEHLFMAQLPVIVEAFKSYNYLELSRTDLIFRS